MLADIEQQLAALSLLAQAMRNSAGKAIGCKEIQIIGSGQLLVIQLQQGPCLRRTGIRYQNIDTAKPADRGHDSALSCAIFGNVHFNR